MAPDRIVSLGDLMEQLKAREILDAVATLASMGTKWGGRHGDFTQPEVFRKDTYELFRARVVALEQALAPLDVPISHEACLGILAALDNAVVDDEGSRILVGQNLASANFHNEQLCNTLGAELSQRLFVKLKGSNREYFDQDYGLFGDEVDDAFPDAITEISEAGKCMALERYTAAVFHLMRAMEIGIRVLATKLGANILNKHGDTLPWGILIANIKGKIEALPDGQEKDDWLVLHSLLHSANRAYRTKTAHPATSYDEKQAFAAFHATKSFLIEMAERA